MLEGREAVFAVELGDEDECHELKDSVQYDEACHGSPNPSPPRVGADANGQSYQTHCCKANAKLGEVLSRGPQSTEQAVFVITFVLYA